MPILFYTLNYPQQYFVFADHVTKSWDKGVQVEYLNQKFQIADEDEEESFKAYLVEVVGAFFDDNSRFLDAQTVALAPEELRRFIMIYMPFEKPALFVINRESHDGLVRINISHYEKYMPQVNHIFNQLIEAGDQPDPADHQMPDDWLER